MELFFIRHAQSVNNALIELTGSDADRDADPKLTETGRRQAERLAEFLKTGEPDPRRFEENNHRGFEITHLYCSLMIRSIETGLVVSEALGVPLEALEDLHEEGGIYRVNEATGEPEGLPGKPRSHFEEHYPDLLLPEHLDENGWWNRPFEQRETRWERAHRIVQELQERHGNSDDRVAVISHGGFYNLYLKALLPLPRDGLWFTLFNTGISRLDFHSDLIELVYQNRVDFLPQGLTT